MNIYIDFCHYCCFKWLSLSYIIYLQGKRKTSARGPAKKLKQRLDTQFSCLFCNHEKAVTCSLDKKTNIGTLNCKICGQSFQSPINSLSQPIDIYSDWVDACEAVAQEQAEAAQSGYTDKYSDDEERDISRGDEKEDDDYD